MFGAGADRALERVRMDIDESRKDRAPVKAARRAEIFWRLGDAGDAAFRVANDGQAANEAAVLVDEIGQPRSHCVVLSVRAFSKRSVTCKRPAQRRR